MEDLYISGFDWTIWTVAKFFDISNNTEVNILWLPVHTILDYGKAAFNVFLVTSTEKKVHNVRV